MGLRKVQVGGKVLPSLRDFMRGVANIPRTYVLGFYLPSLRD
jgi:hypothetical protein